MHPRDFFSSYWRSDFRNEVFVAMSFEAEFTNVWKCAIEPAISEAVGGTLKPVRIDTTTLAGDTVLKILDGVCHSKLVFVDISIQKGGRWAGQRNGNVMYELGLAHAWREASEVIMVRSDSDPIAFDVQSMFVHSYNANDLSSAKARFKSLIESSLGESGLTKALKIRQAIQGLDHLALAFIAMHYDKPFFWVADFPPRPSQDYPVQALREELNNRSAILRLLDSGILATDTNCDDGEHRAAFHWTAFGKAVLKALEWPVPNVSGE